MNIQFKSVAKLKAAFAGEGGSAHEWIRTLLVLAVWSIWLPARFIVRSLRLLFGVLCTTRLRRFLSAGILAVIILLSVQAGPLIYGRFSLSYEAAHLARTSLGRSEAEIQSALNRTAFKLGFTDVITQDEAFAIERDYDDDGTPRCGISINLSQQVNWLGVFRVPVRIRTRVARSVNPEVVKPTSWEERLFGE